MDFSAAFERGLTHHRAGRLDAAADAYNAILAIDPDHFDALYGLALLEGQRGRFGAALERLDHVVAINGSVAAVHFNRAICLQSLNRLEDAVAAFGSAIACNADYVEAYLNRGRTLSALGHAAAALDDFERVVALNPNSAEVHYDRGNVLGGQGDHAEALASFDRAIALQPNFAAAHAGRGHAYVALNLDDQAIPCFDQAIALKADDASVLKARANALLRRGRTGEVLEALDQILRLEPNDVNLWIIRGNVLRRLGRYEEARASFEKATACDGSYVPAYVGLSAVLLDQNRYEEALAAADRAVALDPTSGGAHCNRAVALDNLDRAVEAAESYATALKSDPGIELAAGRRLLKLMQVCQWDEIDQDIVALLKRVDEGHLATAPFGLLMTPSSPAQQRRIATLFAEKETATAIRTPLLRRTRGSKIRVGYFSADFHNHATAYLAAGLFEHHDRNDFEIIAFAFDGVVDDAMGRRLRRTFDRFIDVQEKSDGELVDLARDLEIDIAVDLKGHTHGSRPGLFVSRVAPLQVNYLGYPGTFGLDAMDYIIADPVLIPPTHYSDYSEKVVSLPPCYQVNDDKRVWPQETPSRAALGLPDDAFVFCGFANTYKITPQVFDVWMRLLQKVPGSVLWLQARGPLAARNLQKEAVRRGIDPKRLVFASPLGLSEHLARYRTADLFLDTWPCNAHTTASDVLWMGLPMVTLKGGTFASSVAASTLTAVDLPQLITETPEAYEALALALATDAPRRRALRQHLADRRTTCTLFNTARFTRNLEAAYKKMWDIHAQGCAPEHFTIDSNP